MAKKISKEMTEALKTAKSPEDLSKVLEAEGFDMEELSLDDLDVVSGGRYGQGGFPKGGNFGGMLKAYYDSSGNMHFYFTPNAYTDELGMEITAEQYEELYFMLRAAFPELECENNIRQKVNPMFD